MSGGVDHTTTLKCCTWRRRTSILGLEDLDKFSNDPNFVIIIAMYIDWEEMQLHKKKVEGEEMEMEERKQALIESKVIAKETNTTGEDGVDWSSKCIHKTLKLFLQV
jgi:hypothetical protein